MKKITSITIVFISIFLLASLFLPLWNIELEAPQYPEGLSMQIWLDKFGGDINTINGLNHYIGMKHIEPEMFPEFGYMKYIVIGLSVLGVLVGLIKNKALFLIWVLVFIVIAGFGIYDFYLWSYDYGHNLDPRAAIKVPGMSYQPPIIGCKQLLNFNACSFPDKGGLILIFSGFTALVFLYLELFKFKKNEAKK